ncbi:MAG: SDR family NAD(P)-dependent oxidoreductase [Deltaproteobacteria bacterium]|nr:SDR family NAD(P)-dependent oxidoreductase [Deltaproteobacteria bacterium]
MDKVALVTAATSDLGKAIVLELAELIKGVAVHYQTNREKALKLVQELKDRGLSAVALAADLTKAGEAARLVKEVERLLGRLDILVNNYGPLLVKPWTDCTPAEVETLWRANVLSAWETMQAALPGMRRRQWGRIVNLGYSRVDEYGLPRNCGGSPEAGGHRNTSRTIRPARRRGPGCKIFRHRRSRLYHRGQSGGGWRLEIIK